MYFNFSQISLITFLSAFMALGYADSEVSNEALYKPFILSQHLKTADINKVSTSVKQRIKAGGFDIVGEYSPYTGADIIIISSPALRRYASQSENGIYAAIQRVSVTVVDNTTQVSFTNPTYMAHAYRLNTDLADIKQRLKKLLGFIKEFGSAKGLSKTTLRKFRYKQWMMMPNFTDHLELAGFPNQKIALKTVLKKLRNNKAGVKKVYQVTLEGKNETMIGIKLSGSSPDDCGSDSFIMKKIDTRKIKSTGHLPYEILIKNGNVYALFAEFRIALNFPDLSMMGKNGFTSIMCAPGSIQAALTLATGGSTDDGW